MAHDALDPHFRTLIDEHAPVHQLGSEFQFTEGPIWHPVDRYLLFSDMPGDTRRRWDATGGVREVVRPSNKGNGMTYDRDLNLIVCEHATSSVARFRPDGTREVLASHFEGRELNSPNDVCVAVDGSIWFTDPTYGRMPGFGVERPTQLGFQGVYRLAPDHVPGTEPELVSERHMFTQPNGLCFSPDGRLLYVNDTVQTNIRVFEVGGRRLFNGRIFASGIVDAMRPGVPDGMKCDAEGNVWVTAPGGLWVYAPDGRLIGKVGIPEMAANLAWGGEDWRTLFVCATHSVYAVKTKVGPRNEPYMRSDAGAAPRTVAAEPGGLAIDPAHTALILQDLQNDVIMEGGAFAASGSPAHARAQNVVENARRLAEVCRAKGIRVYHVWFVCEAGHPAMAQNAPLFQGLVGANALVRGTWGVQPVAPLAPEPGDLVIEKMTMSAWPTSRLERHLRGTGVDTILNCGAWTNMSVEHTARTAADLGFRVVVPEDCCSTMNAEWHRASLEFAMSQVATVTRSDAVIRALGG
ncbi:MAG: isochorismatase family protein [Pseudomonadota bacterium]